MEALIRDVMTQLVLDYSGHPDGHERTTWRSTLKAMCHKTISRVTNKHYTIEVRTTSALWKRFRQRLAKELLDNHHHSPSQEDSPKHEWIMTSRWNVRRTVYSSVDLANLLLPAPETTLMNSSITTNHDHNNDPVAAVVVRVQRQSGFICVTTPDQVKRQQQLENLFPCPLCADWLVGSKGVWWHTLQQHQQDYHQAVQQAAPVDNSLALVVYNHCSRNSSSNLMNGTSIKDAISREEKKDGECTRTNDDQPNAPSPRFRQSPPKDVWQCAQDGDLVTLKQIIAAQPNMATAVDRNGANLLLWAAGSGSLDVVRYLVEDCHCSVDAVQTGRRSFAGRSALHWAARKGHLTVVRYLVTEQQANVHTATDDGTTAFHWAAWQGHLDILQFLAAG